MDFVLNADHVNKDYGKHHALKDFSLSVPKGRIVSILGPNGAGKTTFIKIVSGLIHPTKGSVFVSGEKVGLKTKKSVAYLPDRSFLYQWFTVKDAIRYFSAFFDDFDEHKAREILEQMKLSERQKIISCSKGMQEKINMALTVSRKANLFVFDEPLATVDPLTRDFMIDTIKSNMDRENASMLISTHLVNDVESLFDDVAVVFEGRLLLSGNVDELKAQYGMSLENLFKEVIQHVQTADES